MAVQIAIQSFHKNGGNIYVDFSTCLHTRASGDFALYRKDYDGGLDRHLDQDHDSKFLRELAGNLLMPGSGVTGVNVKSYSIQVQLSQAFTVADLTHRITGVCRRLQMAPVVTELTV